MKVEFYIFVFIILFDTFFDANVLYFSLRPIYALERTDRLYIIDLSSLVETVSITFLDVY